MTGGTAGRQEGESPVKTPTERPLTEKQARFVAEYVAMPHAARAARRAGYSAHPASAWRTSSSLLAKPHIVAAVAAGNAAVAQRLEASAEALLRHAVRVIRADLGRLIGDDGRPKDLGEIDAETLAALQVTTTYDRKGRHKGSRVRRLDKMAALALVCRYLELSSGRIGRGNSRPLDKAIARARARTR